MVSELVGAHVLPVYGQLRGAGKALVLQGFAGGGCLAFWHFCWAPNNTTNTINTTHGPSVCGFACLG